MLLYNYIFPSYFFFYLINVFSVQNVGIQLALTQLLHKYPVYLALTRLLHKYPVLFSSRVGIPAFVLNTNPSVLYMSNCKHTSGQSNSKHVYMCTSPLL